MSFQFYFYTSFLFLTILRAGKLWYECVLVLRILAAEAFRFVYARKCNKRLPQIQSSVVSETTKAEELLDRTCTL